MFARLLVGTRALQSNLFGETSNSAPLAKLLPMACVLFFGALSVAALSFPGGYDWRIHTISKLTSADRNPAGFRLAAVGIAAAMFLIFPFARYVSQNLQSIAPRAARLAGLAFGLGFCVTIFTMLTELAQLPIHPKLHNGLAHTSGALFIAGMICCCFCALKDRLQYSTTKATLPLPLTCYWTSLTVAPIVGLAFVGALVLIGKHTGWTAVEQLRQSFRNTNAWRLAFWEWLGVCGAFAFMLGTIWLLPGSNSPAKDDGAQSRRLLAREANVHVE